MGVWHLMSLGESPGAVTAPLAYIKRRFEQGDVSFFGSDSGRHKAKKVSGIIIFTTPEVCHKQRCAGNKKYKDNSYGSDQGPEYSLGDDKGNLTTFEIVRKFIAKEFEAMLQEEKGKVYWLEANYYDLDFNVRQLAQAFLALSPPGKVGREVWVNLTGGSNVMNLAASLVTSLSGITGRAYYTYTQNIQLLRPASEANFWYDLPVFKVNFDPNYEAVLRVLDENGGWVDSDKLFSLVQQRQYGQFPAERGTFARDFLNKLDGWLIERDGNKNRILQPGGKRLLGLIADEHIRALAYKEALAKPLEFGEIFEEVL